MSEPQLQPLHTYRGFTFRLPGRPPVRKDAIMSPEEKHADAVEAAHEWRDEERGRKHASGKANDVPPEWLSDSAVAEPDEHSVLRRFAEANPESGLIELTGGVWYVSKRPGEE